MRHKSYILLLLASVIILTSMSECKFSLTRQAVEHSYVEAEVNGELFSATIEEPFLMISGPTIYLYQSSRVENEFAFSLACWIESADGNDGISINIFVDDVWPVELDRRYEFIPGIRTDDSAGASFIYQSYYEDGRDEPFSFNDCKGGYVIFNEVEDSGYHAPLSGTFEFTAYDPVHDSTVVVTNGKFRLDRVD